MGQLKKRIKADAQHKTPAIVATHGISAPPRSSLIETRQWIMISSMDTCSPSEEQPAAIRENLRVGMVRPHMRDIPDVPFPAGYGMRLLRRDEGPLWLEIERDAEQWSSIDDDYFAKEFGVDPEGIEQRCYFVVNPDGEAIGTISAWYTDYHGENCGRLHWFAIRPAYQGRGLGRPVMSFFLHRLAQLHPCAYLITSTARLPALKLYLDYGFLPDLELPDALDAWRKVKEVLPHPALDAIE
ncbi:MAG TPA: GNAT family N-acetyltransferase [Armatimonadota bacterium]